MLPSPRFTSLHGQRGLGSRNSSGSSGSSASYPTEDGADRIRTRREGGRWEDADEVRSGEEVGVLSAQ